jgi:hypothetical protein
MDLKLLLKLGCFCWQSCNCLLLLVNIHIVSVGKVAIASSFCLTFMWGKVELHYHK